MRSVLQCAVALAAFQSTKSNHCTWHRSKKSGARVGRIYTPHGIIDTPGFVAVGTNAALKAVDGPWADAEGQQLMFCVSAAAGFGSRHSGKQQYAAACDGDVSVRALSRMLPGTRYKSCRRPAFAASHAEHVPSAAAPGSGCGSSGRRAACFHEPPAAADHRQRRLPGKSRSCLGGGAG